MAREVLTDRRIKGLKPAPPGRRFEIMDAVVPNLGIRVTDRGKRTFIFLSRFPGKANPVRRALGEYGALSLGDAREKARDWHEMIAKGIDPGEAMRRAKAEAEAKPDLSFGAVMEDYIARHVAGQRKALDVSREIRNEIIPVWRDRLVTEITRGDVVALVESIADRPAPYQARNIFGHVRTFFNWLIDRGKYGIEISPCDRIKPARLIGEKKARQRVLNDDELLAFWRAAGRLRYPYGPLFRLLALTGQRKSEVGEARWREFHPELVRMLRERKKKQSSIEWQKVDQNLKFWTVPPERFKSNASHIVPLSDDVLAILETLPHFAGRGTGDHLFSTTMGEKPVNGFSKAKERLDREMRKSLRALARWRAGETANIELPPFVIHDVRRTVRTRLSALRIPEPVAEMVIGHGRKGLARIYDQHQFVDEMREALDAWAARLHQIAHPVARDNVVELSEARRW